MPTPTRTDDAALASALRLSVMRLARRLRAQRPDDSLTLTQVSALATLERHGPLTLGELAAHERVRPPSMTRVVVALEEQALVARTPHPSDGRQVLLAATDAGVRWLRRDRKARDAWLARRLRELSAPERDTLHAAAAVLERLAAAES